MNNITKAAVIAIAAGAVLVQRVLFSSDLEIPLPTQDAGSAAQVSAAALKGTIVSVEESPSKQGPSLRRAAVKLDSGETVRAWVPDACVVFPGYVTRLARRRDDAGEAYFVTEGI